MRQKIIIISSDMIISNDNFYIIFCDKNIQDLVKRRKKKEAVNFSNYYLSLQFIFMWNENV